MVEPVEISITILVVYYTLAFNRREESALSLPGMASVLPRLGNCR